MKRLFILIACLSIGIKCKAAEPVENHTEPESVETYDVFLLIGQSNMAGRGYMIEGDDQVIDENVFILNDKGEVVPATNPLNQYSSIRKSMSMQRIGPGFSFSKKIAQETGRKILLVVNAKGGSNLREWMMGAEAKFYDEAIRRTRQALKHNGKLKAILWHQGESNAWEADYLTELAKVVAGLRKDLDAPELPFIAGEIAYWKPSSVGFNKLISTIGDVIDNADYVSAKDCTMLIDEKDPHFSRDGQILLGERYADKVLKMCY